MWQWARLNGCETKDNAKVKSIGYAPAQENGEQLLQVVVAKQNSHLNCFNCGGRGHTAPTCTEEAREPGGCYNCGSVLFFSWQSTPARFKLFFLLLRSGSSN